MRIAVGIATKGRPAMLGVLVDQLTHQTRRADAIFICPASAADIDPADVAGWTGEVAVVSGEAGICAQRNRILREVESFDAIVFFDDDFIPAPSYLAQVEMVFQDHPGLIAMSGAVILDGASGPGISLGKALAAIGRVESAQETVLTDQFNVYGCNMALRLQPIFKHQIDFDEALPLYGWFEDVDLSRRLGRYGRVVRCDSLAGVHLGIKTGRTPGAKLGYSQIANPFYLYRKGVTPLDWSLKQMVRNTLANALRAIAPEPWCDRRGRLSGNLRALFDITKGKIDPKNITGI